MKFCIFALLAVYSAAMVAMEFYHGRAGVRPYFSDIVGPVPFHGVNTTFSASMLWASSLLFAVLRRLDRVCPRRVAFYTSQAFVFFYLGFDERFMVHEWFDLTTGIKDSYLLVTVGLLEVGFLVFLGDLRSLPESPRRWLAGAIVFYGTSLLVDTIEPPGLKVRLALEDLPKAWAGVCLFLFAWGLFTRVAAGRRQDQPALKS